MTWLHGIEQKPKDKSHYRQWDLLIPEMLIHIFSFLSLREVLTVAPCVCKSWNKVVMDPCCWQTIDIISWSANIYGLHGYGNRLDKMLRILLNRSRGSCRKLSAFGLAKDRSFVSISKQAQSLQILVLPVGKFTESTIVKVADKFSNLTYLDLSCCLGIGAKALEAIGKHCKSLSVLKRSQGIPRELDCQDDNALAIANNMPKLKHLDMKDVYITNVGFNAILAKCLELEFLDITGCLHVKFESDVLKGKHPNLTILGPEKEKTDEDEEFIDWAEFDPTDSSDDEGHVSSAYYYEVY